MQPLIHKAKVALTNPTVPMGVSPGDRASLVLEVKDVIAVYVARRSRLPLGIGGPVYVRLGFLEPDTTQKLLPALEQKAKLRVRIVEVEPAFLSRSGRRSVFISVWGDPKILGRAHPIFSAPGKINLQDPYKYSNEAGKMVRTGYWKSQREKRTTNTITHPKSPTSDSNS